MSYNCYMRIITPEMLEETKHKVAHRIKLCRRHAEACRGIASSLDGAYVTERIKNKLLKAIPGASRVYIDKGKYSSVIFLDIEYPDMTQYSRDDKVYVQLCNTDTRRINAEKLLQDAMRYEQEAEAYDTKLSCIDSTVSAYNTLCDQYARIHQMMIGADIPYPDYDLEKRYKTMPLWDLAALIFAKKSPQPSAANQKSLRPSVYSLDSFVTAFAQ